MILSHLVSHTPSKIRFETPGFTCTSDEIDDILVFLRDEMSTMLQGLMFSALKRVLCDLEDLCRRANPSDWPTIYLSLCAVLFAAESMAVDRYMRETEQNARRSVREMEESVMFFILGHLRMSTRGHNPLDLDWSLSKNMALVNNDATAIYALRRLQMFREMNGQSGLPILLLRMNYPW